MSESVERIRKSLDEDDSLSLGEIHKVESDVRELTEGKAEKIQKRILTHLKTSPERFVLIDIYDTMIHCLYKKEVIVKIRQPSNSQLYIAEKEKTYLISVLFDFTPSHVKPEKSYKRLKDAGSVVYTIENIEDIDFAFYEFDKNI